MALGTAEATPLEVAQAYTAFANSGILATPHPTRRVTNSDGVGITETRPETRQVLRPPISWLMTNIMQDVLDHGTAARARSMGFTAQAAGKTGTSRDGWFAGYTPNLLCVVWVGFDDNSELGLEGAKSALPIWTSFMKQALALRPDLGGEAFPKAIDGIVSADIDPTTGFLATDSCPSHRTEFFIEGSQPTDNCRAHSGEPPALPGIPGFTWPEDLPDKAKQAAKDAEKAIDDAEREIRKQAKKAAGKQ